MEEGFVGVGVWVWVGIGVVGVVIRGIPGVGVDEVAEEHVPNVGVEVGATWDGDGGNGECGLGDEAAALDGGVCFVFDSEPEGEVCEDRGRVVDSGVVGGQHGERGCAVLGEEDIG